MHDPPPPAPHRRLAVVVFAVVCLIGVPLAWVMWPNKTSDKTPGETSDKTPDETSNKPAADASATTKPAPVAQSPGAIPPLPAPASGPALTDFVGAEACAPCHQDQFEPWTKSTHGRAGGAPGTDVVASDFNGTRLQFSDAEVTLEVTDKDRFQFHIEPAGEPRTTLEVAAFVGGGHMMGGGTQTAFARFPDNSLRLIPFDYSKTDDVWFCEATQGRGWTPISPELALADCVYWPPKSNFGPICGNCHASQTVEGYAMADRRETTEFRDLRINCESCHGPGRRHLEIMSATGPAPADIGLTSLATLDKEASVAVCLRCHATTQPLAPGYLPGKRFQDHYALNFYVRDKHFADGRTNGFAYQEGHLWSDCYLNGSMTCVDCHSPHTGGYRDVNRRPLAGKLDDGQCVGCHAAKAAPSTHSQHPAGSASCVSCHMPFQQLSDLGSAVTYTRSDHVISIPRPDHDRKMGVATACASSGCHAKEAPDWARAQVKAMWGTLKPQSGIIRDLITAQTSAKTPEQTAAFLAEHPPHPAAEFERLRSTLARLQYLDEAVVNRIEALTRHDDLDVRALAFSYLHEAVEQLPRLKTLISEGLRAQGDDTLAVRRRWSLWLALRGTKYSDRGRLPQAIAALELAVQVDPTSREAWSRLAAAHDANGASGEARSAWSAALASGPRTLADHRRLWTRLCAAHAKAGGTHVDADRICAEEAP